MTPYKELLDNTRWSYSRIHTYTGCPAAFKLIYLEHCDKINNAFAEFGSLCHSILEDYEKGELMEYELEDEFDSRWDKFITCEFPLTWRGSSMGESYYEKGKAYFSSFEGFPQNWEVIGAELEAEFEIDGRKIIGFIDLLVRDRDDGKLIVVDHKSKARFKSEKEKAEYAIQLYLYAKWVFDHYGEYPKTLIFNMFREHMMVEIPFSQDAYESALQWVMDSINAIYADEQFEDRISRSCREKNTPVPETNDDFFCNHLCSCRESCERMKGNEIL